MNCGGDPEADDLTIDAFHRGAFYLVQREARSHRAGMDAMVLASAVPDGFHGRLADLGAGAGAGGLAVLSRCDDARVVLVEKSTEMADCARKSLLLHQNTYFSARAEVLEADVALSGRDRTAAGLRDRSFEFVIMNPPFNDSTDRRTRHALKAQAHVMADNLFESWLRTAAAIVKPGGHLALIARPQSLAEILNALDGRFGDVRIVALHPRPGATAIRVVVKARHGARGKPGLLPSVFLHDTGSGEFSEHADGLINGTICLFPGG